MYPGKAFKFELSKGKDEFKSFSVSAWVTTTEDYKEDGRFFLYYPEKE